VQECRDASQQKLRDDVADGSKTCNAKKEHMFSGLPAKADMAARLMVLVPSITAISSNLFSVAATG
jgi:hypothetical protein